MSATLQYTSIYVHEVLVMTTHGTKMFNESYDYFRRFRKRTNPLICINFSKRSTATSWESTYSTNSVKLAKDIGFRIRFSVFRPDDTLDENPTSVGNMSPPHYHNTAKEKEKTRYFTFVVLTIMER